MLYEVITVGGGIGDHDAGQVIAVAVMYPDGRLALFEPVLPPPTLLIFGGDQMAVPLVRFANHHHGHFCIRGRGVV